MILSVIIVSYNVRDLLGKCLGTVVRALESIPSEILVIDNASADGTVSDLRPRFPSCTFIANTENIGFSKANNQGLALAKGEFVLFLNPDTEVPADCFNKCLEFMQGHPEAGALGVRMVNGHGVFLKESKRGFPSPMVSFWKLTGFSSLFPRSKVFARYYLGHLDEHQTHEADILSGAFMFVRKAVLDKTGGFDERFFMYAEDIDLSYRITQAGYKNYYYPGVTILHYKGESTRKDLRYVQQFYRAMSQFVKKYYGTNLFSMLLDTAIWLRAAVEVIIPRKNNTTR